MKILKYILIILMAFATIAAAYKPYSFPFIGRWQSAEDPLLIDDYGFQDIQNLRKDGNHFKGVSGHTAINSTAWSATNEYPTNGFHFRKYQPAESHIIVTGVDSAEGNPILFQNIVAVAGTGDFSGTALYTEDTAAGLGRYSDAPQGNMIYCNAAESLIWGGDELQVAGFEVYNPDGSFLYNYYEQVSNTLTSTGNLAIIAPSAAAIDSYTKLLLHYNGDDASTVFTDSGDTTHTVTPNGNVHTDTAYKKFGTASGLFDGTGDYLTVPDHADWTVGTGEFTIDTWVKIDSVASDRCIVSHLTDDDNWWEFYVDTNGALTFAYYDATVLEVDIASADGLIVIDTAYHVEMCRDDSDNWTLWIDGETVAGISDASAIDDLTGTLHIGRLNKAAPEDDFDGWIDELKFSKGIQRHSTDFEPPVLEYSGTGISYIHIGSPRPLAGFKAYVQTANTAAGTMTVYYWDDSDWVAVSTLVDNTDTGASFAQTGAVTFDSTVSVAKASIINELQLYWYKVVLDACDNTTTLSYVTLNAPMQPMTNLWDGSYSEIAQFFAVKTEWEDYTKEVQDDTQIYYADVSALTSTQYLLFGFTEQQQGFSIEMVAKYEQINWRLATVSYWNGSAWTGVSNLTDGTRSENGVISLNKSGPMTWSPIAQGSEFERKFNESSFLYWYKINFSSGTLSANTRIAHIKGIEAPQPIKGYKFPGLFQNRSWLFSEDSGYKSKAIYSAYNAPFIFNGSDSGIFYFGDDSPLTASARIYNVYRTTGIEQLIVTKTNETYRIFGDGPDNWESQQLSGNVGCIAPLSMVVCEISDINDDVKRHVAIWQSSFGVIMTDGATIDVISDDIKNYWDTNSSDYIPASKQGDSVGWYNPNIQSYTLLISSGSGQATHNVELEYSLKYREWTKIYRENGSGANPLQVGFQVLDTTGNIYAYGLTDEGVMYRLENGNAWGSTAIAQYIHTKDFLFDNEIGFFKSTIAEYMRLLYETKTGTAEVAIAHYCDGTLTVDGTDNQAVPDAIDITSGNSDTQSCVLGPCMKHSFKFSTSTSDVADGMELTGLGIYYDSLNIIQE